MAYTSIGLTEGSGANLATVTVDSKHAFVKALGLDVSGGGYQVITTNTGTVDAGCMRVTLASDGTGQVKLAAGTAEIGKLAAGVAEIGNVKNAGVFAVQEDGPAATSLALLADVVSTDDTSTHSAATKGLNLMAVATPTDTVVGSNDIGMLAMSLDRRLLVDCDLVAHTGTTITVDAANDNSFVAQLGDGTSLATIRNLAANDALNVAMVDGSGDQITSFGGGTQYTAGDSTFLEATTVVTGSGVVRLDSAASLVDTDTEITMLQVDSAGALRVTGGGGGTEYNESATTPATITGTATMMERDDSLADLGTIIEGEWAALRCTAEGAQWVQDFNSDAILADTTAILADTANMDTNLITIAGAVTGTEMQVDVVAALPAGTNAIGKLAANTGVDIGDVDVTSVVPGTAATNLGKAISSVVGVTDTGVAGLGEVAANQITTIPEGAGDYTTLRVSTQGNLHTSDLALSLTVVAAGNAPPATAINNGAVDSGNILREIRCNTTGQLEVALVAGTAAYGKLAANSGVDIGDVDVLSSALPTGAATSAAQLPDGHAVTVDNASIAVTIAQAEPVYSDGQGTPQYHMSVMKNSSQIIWNGAAFDIQYATVTATASGDNTVVDVSAVGATGDRVLVLAYATICAGTVKETGSWKTGSTSRSGVMGYAADGGGGIANFNEAGWFLGAADEDLIFNNVAGSDIGGHVTYALVQ